MIPVRLELHNFLAYREPQPLDLSGLHVVCLAGSNGAGKSALLDAMTWALWGKARARQDNELIHTGQTEMQVSLTFRLGDNLYRVTRYRSSAGSGRSLLTLDIQDGDDWRSLSESTIRATQEKIDSLLRLDYQTFINSAFLMQGRADEFTRKTPSERKAILSDILGLEAWYAYEERAKQHIRQIDEERSQIDYEIDQIDAELRQREAYQAELIQARRGLDELTEQARRAEAAYRRLEHASREREACRTRYRDFDQRLAEDRARLERRQAEREEQNRRLAVYRQLIASSAEIEAGYAILQESRAREREMSERLLEQSSLREQLADTHRAVDAARSQLLAEQRALQSRRSSLESTIAEGALNKTLHKAQTQLAELETLENRLQELRDRRAALREQMASLEAENHNLKAAMDSLAYQRDQIRAVTDPVCPLCEQELSLEHRTHLLSKLEADGNQKAATYRSNRERIEALEAEIADLDREFKAAAPRLQNLLPLREHVARLIERIEQASKARSELEMVDRQLTELETTLATENYAHAERARASKIEAQLAALGYDVETHRQARAVIDQYMDFEMRRAELERAREDVPRMETAIAELEHEIAALESRIAENRAMCNELLDQLQALDAQLTDYERYRQELEQLRDAEADARHRVGAAEQRLNALQVREARRAELVKRRDRLGEERSIYEELRLAFSKDGIPAMIIEMAIPEIENEANQILSAMTDGQMHIRFDTQREKVTGGARETLDIKIADGLGTRDYATFSGGETFRVNFAIRLALSRLLARRAGAQLRTLFIDEGFGTQDTQGRERLVQAIQAIQDEFDLILVITHIDELKEAFPARIEITKLTGGSVIEVI